jgi:hypothetical protein
LILRSSVFVGLLLLGAAGAQSLPGPTDPPAGSSLSLSTLAHPHPIQNSGKKNFGRLPLSFESNQGQTDPKVRFLTRSAGNTLFLTPSEAVFTMLARTSPARKDRPTREGARVAVRMQMVGADPNAHVLQQQPLAGRINYFIGQDPRKWHADVPTFGKVGFHQVYPGVDLVYYGNQQRLEYDFVVAPHADPKQINLHFAGAEGVRIDAAGNLLVRTQDRELMWQKPTVYQQDATGKHVVTARFHLKKLPSGQIGVSFALGRYDTARPLVIDPILLYSTFLGGTTGSTGAAITVDSSGSAYVTGTADTSDFPVTAGAYQTAHPFSSAFVTKLNPAGSALVYSTFLGGHTSGGEFPAGIVVDSAGNAYITGTSNSADYPTTPGAFQTVRPNQGAGTGFITKLNPTGTALVYSTFLGGSVTEKSNAIAIDSSGAAYVTGQAYSLNFPTTPGAFQTAKAPNPFGIAATNAFVTKLNPAGSALVYSTYLSGTGTQFSADLGVGIAVDSDGNAYVTGRTNSLNFPTTTGAYQTTNATVNTSQYIGFVTKFNPTGTALVYSTFLGGAAGSFDGPTGIALDSSGDAYITGFSYNADFPTTPGAFQKVRHSTDATAFVTKLNPTGTALVYSTFVGGAARNSAQSIAIDSKGDAAVAGLTFAADFPTVAGGFQRASKSTSGGNAFVTELNPSGSAVLYSSYLGGGTGDSANGVAIGSNGNLYVTGKTTSTDFPTTTGAFQPSKSAITGFYNAFVTRLSPIPIYPDFNNDGSADLIIQNGSTGQVASWFMNGAQWTGGAFFSLNPTATYAVVGTGDFYGNGSNALVLENRADGSIVFWYTGGTNNATITGGEYCSVVPYAGWRVVGVGDFNGDGKSDLVFQNQTTNQVAVWYMNGPTYAGGIVLPFTPPAGWTVAGVGDLNADGLPDLVFQNQNSGQIALWYMNHTDYIGGTVMNIVPVTGWKIVGVGDYNGDGYADLLFQNQTTNQAAVWYLQNGGFVGGDVLSVAPPTGWKIVGPR